MKKPLLSASTLKPNKKTLNSNPETKVKRKNKGIIKRDGKRFVKKKKIIFGQDVILNNALRGDASVKAYFENIKSQNERFHSAGLDDHIKSEIEQSCDLAIKNFGELPSKEILKLIELMKLGYRICLSDLQHIFPIVEEGKAKLKSSVLQELQNKKYDDNTMIEYGIKLLGEGVQPHKITSALKLEFKCEKQKANEIKNIILQKFR